MFQEVGLLGFVVMSKLFLAPDPTLYSTTGGVCFVWKLLYTILLLIISWPEAFTGTLSYTLISWSSGRVLKGLVPEYVYLYVFEGFAESNWADIWAGVIVSTTATAKPSDSLYNISISTILKRLVTFSKVVLPLDGSCTSGRSINKSIWFTLFSIKSTTVLL